MSQTPKDKVVAQGRLLLRYADRMAEQATELRRRGEQLQGAAKALDPEAAAAKYHEGIADIAQALRSAGRHIARHVLGQDGGAPIFDLADAKVEVFLSPEEDYCGDDDFDDPETVTAINRRLDKGDTAAWCVLTVRVTWRGFTGTDRLGGVSLGDAAGTTRDSERDALAHANDHDMLATAVAHLARTVREAGWEATFPLPNRGNILAADQPLTHAEPQ